MAPSMYRQTARKSILAGMQGWAGQYSSPRRSAFTRNGLPFQAQQAEKSLNPLREYRRVSQYSGVLLGLSLYSYQVRELLVCWLFFSLAFTLLALVSLGATFACYAGKYVIHWVDTAARVAPVVALAPGEPRLKPVSDGGKLK